jgi:hypothetical protein
VLLISLLAEKQDARDYFDGAQNVQPTQNMEQKANKKKRLKPNQASKLRSTREDGQKQWRLAKIAKSKPGVKRLPGERRHGLMDPCQDDLCRLSHIPPHVG